MQPVGDLCDLLGVSRHSPGVFDAICELLYGDEGAGSGAATGEAAREARLAHLARRMTGRR